MKKLDPLPEDIVTYCLTHAAKCDDEGLHVRRIVLDTAAQEILNLRSRIKDFEQLLEHIEGNNW